MAILTSFSGLNGKLPAAFLLEIAGRRLLLDLGEGPEPGLRPDLTGIGRVDGLFLSHAHGDHVGALDLWPGLGQPPIFATEATFAALPLLGLDLPSGACHVLPLTGTAELLGLPVTLGRTGHAIGGVWLHIGAEGGALYMNDWSRESSVLPFDPPPPAGLVITDLSYGDRDQPIGVQAADLAALAGPGTILPVPVMGRGTEMVLRLTGLGLRPLVCPVILAEMQSLAADQTGLVRPEVRRVILEQLTGIRTVTSPAEASEDDMVVVADTELPDGLTEAFATDPRGHWRFVHTGHVAPGSRAAALLDAGRAKRSPWNVHPRGHDHIWLAQSTAADWLVPAFGDLSAAPRLAAALAPLWATDRVIRTVDHKNSKG